MTPSEFIPCEAALLPTRALRQNAHAAHRGPAVIDPDCAQDRAGRARHVCGAVVPRASRRGI